jgi:hypothetical protein
MIEEAKRLAHSQKLEQAPQQEPDND